MSCHPAGVAAEENDLWAVLELWSLKIRRHLQELQHALVLVLEAQVAEVVAGGALDEER